MTKKFIYMNNSKTPKSNFSLIQAGGIAGLGGMLYGGAYTGVKDALSANKLSPEELRNEVLANAAGGAASGLGIYGLSKLGGLLSRIKK